MNSAQPMVTHWQEVRVEREDKKKIKGVQVQQDGVKKVEEEDED